MLRVRFQHAPHGASPRWSNDIVDTDGASADLLRDRARLGTGVCRWCNKVAVQNMAGSARCGRQAITIAEYRGGVPRRCATPQGLMPGIDVEAALLLSQAGPHAARAFAVFRTSAEVTVPSPRFRVLLLRLYDGFACRCPSPRARAFAAAALTSSVTTGPHVRHAVCSHLEPSLSSGRLRGCAKKPGRGSPATFALRT